jgi:uncharacterized 2Fe-2S/4Fe-4S cluster protein (DUF4445 family)
MAETRKILFLPMDRPFPAAEDETVLDTAMRSGVHINASCGGNGACGKCRIRIVEGDATSPHHPKIAQWEYDSGVRLACLTRPLGDITVEIPFESQVDKAALKKKTAAPHILAVSDLDRLVEGWSVNPSVFKKYLELSPPSLEENTNDLERLTRKLRKTFKVHAISVDFRLLVKLAGVLRQAEWRVTSTVVLTSKGYTLINVEPGNTEERNYSIVIDIGTTTVWGQLLDLAHCQVFRRFEDGNGGTGLCTLAEAADYNAQISYGEDVISRIMYAQKPGGLKRLQEVVVSTINGVIRELIEVSRIPVDFISHLVFAGNTTMTHLALGLDPKYLMLSPYVPTTTFVPPVRAIHLGINVKDNVFTYIFPCVASYVGGDIVAGVLGSGIFQREEIALFMDIGTNGEIVVGNKDWLTCTSCSAGPAFEGGGIKFGMRAGKGAVEQVRINPSTLEPMILTIGRTKPAGICGSGLIDAVAEFFEAGIIGQNGKFNHDLGTSRIREGESGWEYVLSYAADTQIGRDIVITEADLDNMIRTKAAIYAGCKTLLDSVGLGFENVDKVVIAGGFGRSIDVEKAQIIGLLPDMVPERFVFVGNGSLLGARLVSFSRELQKEAERIARMMTNIELSNNGRFMDEFVSAQFIPHTDEKAFPTVMEMVASRKEKMSGNA